MALSSYREANGLGASLILSLMAQKISLILVNHDPFSIQANFISRVFCIGFTMIQINCLYFMTQEYIEEKWVLLNTVFLGLMLLNSLGGFAPIM